LLELGCSSLSNSWFGRNFLDNRLVRGTTWFAGTPMSIRPVSPEHFTVTPNVKTDNVADNNSGATATVPVELL